MTDHTGAAGYEMELERTFAAPRERVFDAFIDPDQMKQWWGPQGFTSPVCELDPRMGGKILIHMQPPGAVEASPMEGEFIEVTRPFRLVFTGRALRDAEGGWGIDNLNTVMLTEKDAGTALTLHIAVRKVTDASRPALAGMREGWLQSFDRLEALLAR